MTKRRIDDDERDVMDNPEWSAEDIRAGKRLADFAPSLAATIARALTPSAAKPATRTAKVPSAAPRRRSAPS